MDVMQKAEVVDSNISQDQVAHDLVASLRNLAGQLTVTQLAFDDSNHKPSVDRAKLCGYNPA